MKLPIDFEQAMTAYLGKEAYQLLAEALCMPSPTSIRINGEKTDREKLDILHEAEKVPWCNDGFYLPERPQFTFDPLFHAGCYYVQEASSMFLAHILRHYVKDPIVALDLCAAPGGKSTLALSHLPQGSLLISNEVIRQRANVLAENIIKWGNSYSIVTNNYAQEFQPLGTMFDLIICDAPCSGEGMFRKDPASIDEWSLNNVEVCRKRQRDIAQDIWQTLKDDGLFIYSTCTYNPHEDEENVQWIAETLGADILSSHPLPEWGLTEKNTHFFPHKHNGEGFFISVLRKHPSDNEIHQTAASKNFCKKKEKSKKQTTKIPAELQTWLTDHQGFTLYEDNETFRAFPTLYFPMLQQVKQHLKVLHAGIDLATMKGKNWQPCHSLALSNHLHPQAFPHAEVNEEQAIAYLRTEAIQLPADTPAGYVLITYQGHPLGFAKNIGNRANNLYPAEWKIKSTHIPKK